MWRRLDLVRTDVSEEHASIFKVGRISELVETLAVISRLNYRAKKH
jgi:hypothetical protein